ncbi:hypothetical protein C2G38_2067778 [Gigaspora rosea]|uniref:Uncharacterized protein n=1 Tax=Gigaspora rosea TaxID=44941 RepID=A0A397VZ77_9GLOM|nr:hypothetical protein C2G38_2067778 [Gigaspora rosea]
MEELTSATRFRTVAIFPAFAARISFNLFIDENLFGSSGARAINALTRGSASTVVEYEVWYLVTNYILQ